VVAGATKIEAAPLLSAALQAAGPGWVSVAEVVSEEVLPTYYARLDRWRSGDGPRCVGLERFVQTLESRQSGLQLFVFDDESWLFVGLLDADGVELVDATAVIRQQGQNYSEADDFAVATTSHER
jgi:hypothetical protein